MPTCERLRSIDSLHFATLDVLYARAFPWHEQRESDVRLQVLSHPRYALEAWSGEDVLIGPSGCWWFTGYGYIKHLTTNDTLRSHGYGKQLLTQILTRAPLIVLRIDPLATAIAHKRLRFYQSMGFHANAWTHHHSSYHQNIVDHESLVLSYPQPIDERQYQQPARGPGCKVTGREQPGTGRRPAPGVHWLQPYFLTIGISFPTTLLSP